jgi:hypothetical protein
LTRRGQCNVFRIGLHHLANSLPRHKNNKNDDGGGGGGR